MPPNTEIIQTKVTWGKETYDLSWKLADGIAGYKAALSDMTGVPSDRMKLMSKTKGLWKGVLKDNTNLSTIDFSSYQNKPINILLMGSATTLPSKPKTKTVFIEDLPPAEAAKVASEPSGLVNLGNTCYLNSVTQCLRAITPFRKALTCYNATSSRGITPNQSNSLLVTSLRDTLNKLDSTTSAVSPHHFVVSARMRFPQFAQQSPRGGGWMQQDAEEFYSSLLSSIAEEMSGADALQSALSLAPSNGVNNVVDALFGMDLEETLTCDENPKEISTHHDLARKLVCNIQGGVGTATDSNININHVHEGIHLSLSGKIEKQSESLGRNALYTRTQRLSRLPPYLVVQFGRFYWKATPDSQDHAGVKCKVMKPVTFNDTLDIYEFCSEKLQKIFKRRRDRTAALEEDAITKKLKGEDPEKTRDQEDENKMDISQDFDNVDEEEAKQLRAAIAMSMNTEEEEKEEEILLGEMLPPNFHGFYELFGVVTHKGRDADGGHYMGWVKQTKEGDEDDDNWFVFDDDEVSPCKIEDVLKLKGGGDWHMSYLNFYRAKK